MTHNRNHFICNKYPIIVPDTIFVSQVLQCDFPNFDLSVIESCTLYWSRSSAEKHSLWCRRAGSVDGFCAFSTESGRSFMTVISEFAWTQLSLDFMQMKSVHNNAAGSQNSKQTVNDLHTWMLKADHHTQLCSYVTHVTWLHLRPRRTTRARAASRRLHPGGRPHCP